MSDRLYLAGELLPLPPSKVNLEIVNQNKTVTLLDGQEANQIKPAGLSEVSLELLLPRREYPFAHPNGLSGESALKLLERLKNQGKPFQYVHIRTNGSPTDLTVVLEDYQVDEEPGELGDLRVKLTLKQYRPLTTRTVTVLAEGQGTASVTRSAETAPKVTEYTVKKGDCLWNIAKKYLGNGARYTEIYALNREKIQNPNLIYPGQVLRLPTEEAG